jgi:hypothetical protein
VYTILAFLLLRRFCDASFLLEKKRKEKQEKENKNVQTCHDHVSTLPESPYATCGMIERSQRDACR